MGELYTKEHGTKIIATVEDILGCHTGIGGEVTQNPDGTFEFEYDDNGTEVNWDGQETRTNEKGERLFFDEDFDIFSESQIEIREVCEDCGCLESECECGTDGDPLVVEAETEIDDEDLPTVSWSG
jgi:hypothetical protein